VRNHDSHFCIRGQTAEDQITIANQGAAATVQIVEQSDEVAVLKCTFTPSGEPGARTGRFSFYISEPTQSRFASPFFLFYKPLAP
jgi:hypothetical protein